MKTVVLGLFDDLDDARRVLEELAGSPLDLEAIEVLHRDLDRQRGLSEEFGLRGKRTGLTGLAVGAILGGVAGFLLGQRYLVSLGALLSMTGGVLLGALVGAVAGVMADTLRIPPEHESDVLQALEEGATAIVVRTENLPTARAIGDLFRASGSRELSALEPEIEESTAPPAPAALGAGAPEGQPEEARIPEGHTIFAPPWRRGVGAEPEDAPELEADRTEIDATLGETDARTASAAALDGAAAEAARAETTDDRMDAPTDEPNADPSQADAPGAPLPPPSGDEVALADDADIILLGLSARYDRALRDAGLDTVGALAGSLEEGEEVLLRVPGIGPVAVTRIRERLASHGMPAAASGPAA